MGHIDDRVEETSRDVDVDREADVARPAGEQTNAGREVGESKFDRGAGACDSGQPMSDDVDEFGWVAVTFRHNLVELPGDPSGDVGDGALQRGSRGLEPTLFSFS